MKTYRLVPSALMVFVLSLICVSVALGQRYVDIRAGYGTLQDIIKADSANRAATPNTVYRLHRGAADSVYILYSTLTGWGSMPLQIESVGSGTLPTIFAATLSDGSAISPLISAKANLRMKGVRIYGVNTLGATCNRLVRIQTNGVRVEFDSCQVDESSQSFIRVDNYASGIFLRNCRVSNIWSDFSNARGIDNRGVPIDTLSMTGCSFYRVGQRVYRDGGGILKLGVFNHNTFVDVAQPLLSLGSDSSVVFTNNLVYNCGFLGSGLSAGVGALIDLIALPNQSAYVAHNIFYTDSTKLLAAYPDTVGLRKWFADTLLGYIRKGGTESTNIHSSVKFTMSPDDVPNSTNADSIALWYWANLPASDNDSHMLNVDAGKVNLAYNTNAVAYTWGSDGKPAGATEWFGIPLVAVNPTPGAPLPAGYSVFQNYPNPFNPMTTISYTLPRAGHISVVVYDVLGRQVANLVNGMQPAGQHQTVFDARGVGSGMYFYQLSVDGNFVGVRSMMLVK